MFLDEKCHSNVNDTNITEDLNDMDDCNLNEDDIRMLARDNTLIDDGNTHNDNSIGSHLE